MADDSSSSMLGEAAGSTDSASMRLLHGDDAERRPQNDCDTDRDSSAVGSSACGSVCAAVRGVAAVIKLILQELPVLLWFLVWLLKQKLMH